MTPFCHLHGREVATVLYAMLPRECDSCEKNVDYIAQHGEEAPKLTRTRIRRQSVRFETLQSSSPNSLV